MQYTGYATYNITDDKIRAYFKERLSKEDYEEIGKAGFAYWRGSKCFVAKWSCYAEDTLHKFGIKEIEQDDTPDDAEARADRFSKYGNNAQRSADASQKRSDALLAPIPLGQPILVGHHSEGRHRATLKRADNAMRRAIDDGERAQYWRDRADAAIAHAAYKEQPGVIHRRIQKLEAEERKFQKYMDKQDWLVRHDRYNYELRRDMTDDELEPVWKRHEKWARRVLEHIQMQLNYQRGLYEASGGIAADKQQVEVGGAIKWLGSWHEVTKVNNKTIKVKTGFGYDLKLDKSDAKEIMPKSQYQALLSAAKNT